MTTQPTRQGGREKEMDDLQIIKACAQAMGLEVVEQLGAMRFPNTQFEDSIYDPLHNDAQAMAILKKFELDIEPQFADGEGQWMVSQWAAHSLRRGNYVFETDLNRAICLCVANMRKD